MPLRWSVRDRWFDTYLYDTQRDGYGVLEMRIRAHLAPYRPNTNDAFSTVTVFDRSVIVTHWDDDDFERWKLDFGRVCERHWNRKLWIEPTRPFAYEGTTRVLPALRCMLRVELVGQAYDAHLRASVLKLGGPGTARSSMQMPTCEGRIREFFGSTQGQLDSLDLEMRHDIRQIPAVHEMGHYIGLSHVAGDTNDSSSYGSTPHQRGDVMGTGMRIEAWHAFPWRRAMAAHQAESPLFRVEWRGRHTVPPRVRGSLAIRPTRPSYPYGDITRSGGNDGSLPF